MARTVRLINKEVQEKNIFLTGSSLSLMILTFGCVWENTSGWLFVKKVDWYGTLSCPQYIKDVLCVRGRENPRGITNYELNAIGQLS